MNAQSLSPALSISQSFLMRFGSASPSSQDKGIKENNQGVSHNRLVDDAYQPAKFPASKNATPVNSPVSKPGMAFSRSESINLQFTTKEGDVVKISYNRVETRGPQQAVTKSKNEDAEAVKQQFQPIAKNSVKPSQRAESNDTKVAIPQNTVQKVDSGTHPSAELQNTTNKGDLASSGPNKLVASKRSEFQMEQGDKKLSGTKEEKYTFESKNSPKIKSNSIKNEKQSISTESKFGEVISNQQNKKPSGLQNTSTQTPNPSTHPDKAPVNSITANQENNSLTSSDKLAPHSGNSIQMQQSISRENGDGGSYLLSSDFSLNIEGDLNEAELQSISDLMKVMSQVSHDFFQGGVSHAFSHAENTGFETDQIAGFSMDVNKQKSVKAVAEYRQTAMPDQSINTGLLSEASEFLSQAKESLVDTRTAIDSLVEPEQSFTEMFAGVGQLFYNAYNDKEEQSSGDMFLKMINNINSDFFGKNQSV